MLQPSIVSANTLIQVVIDHSGVLHDEKDPQGKSNFNAFVGDFLAKMSRRYRRDRNKTQIKLISAVEPPYVIWSGTAAEFYRAGLESKAVESVIEGAPRGCNNLIDALKEVALNAEISNQTAEVDNVIHVITSGVHSGPDCESLTHSNYVELVANADNAVVEAFRATSGEFSNFSIHFLTATQRRAFFSILGNSGGGIRLFTQGDQPTF